MKIIIADDEKWVRSTIINLIPFEELGMTLVSEASNGIEALELCKQLKPDILITDIRMPGLTGLELIHELNLILPNIKIIVISGYNDFAYAKTAMKSGVTDYILKPVDELELMQVLQKMKETIISENKLNDEHNYIKSQYKLALPVMHENFLSTIIMPNFLTTEVINSTLNKYDIHFILPEFTIVLFSIDYSSDQINSKEFKKFKILVRHLMKRYVSAITFTKPATDNEIISIINHKQNPNIELLYKALNLCSRIFRKKFCSSLSIGMSLPVHQITRLSSSYSQACEALGERFWDSPGGIFKYHQSKQPEAINIKINESTINEIILNLKLSNYKSVYSYFDELYDRLLKEKSIKPERVKEFSWTFVQLLISRLNIQMSFIDYELSIRGVHPYERMKNVNFLGQLNYCMQEMLLHISNHYHENNPESSINVIETAKKIIEENYYKDMSLEQISKLIHLNPTYFSELFKKELGLSFIDYKTNIRMENARKLLSSTELNVYEISSKIGYSDSKYFSKLFKKITGKTPLEYKENVKHGV